jgi:hypothetical protein
MECPFCGSTENQTSDVSDYQVAFCHNCRRAYNKYPDVESTEKNKQTEALSRAVTILWNIHQQFIDNRLSRAGNMSDFNAGIEAFFHTFPELKTAQGYCRNCRSTRMVPYKPAIITGEIYPDSIWLCLHCGNMAIGNKRK